jgi:uncharacterized protein DUF3185
MRLILGATIAVLGVVLVMHGLGAYDSLASGVSRLLTGTPTDKTLYLLAGGVLAFVIGMAITARRPPKRPANLT